MFKKKNFIRYFIISAIFLLTVFIYGGKLLNMQVANAEQYIAKINIIYRTEKFIIPAVRGEIFDRNGVPLVTNELIYKLEIDGAKFPRNTKAFPSRTEENIINLIKLIDLYGGEIVPHTLPVDSFKKANGTAGYFYSPALSESKSVRDRFYEFLRDNKMSQHISADEFVNMLTAKYNLDELLPPENREHEFFMTVLGVCYDVDKNHVTTKQIRYTISKDISERLLNAVNESSHNYPGAEIMQEYKRVYHLPHSAPHLIGRIGKIPEKQLENYKELGYPMDAIVGLNGVESAFEEYLRGWDGELWRHYDRDGNIISETYVNPYYPEIEKEPIPGKNVYLTLDIKLQQVAEYSVEKTITRIHKESQRYSIPELSGEDAYAGAAAIINPNNGEVLALPTYPSYNLETFNEDFAELNTREKDTPLNNRALFGQYAPGSVFKLATSVAALCSGNLTTWEQIYDRGTYTKYADYQPSCWIHNMYGGSHGSINVTRAIKDSCNYFYFVVGERMAENNDIQLLNSYAQKLGLGTYTGIEIGETQGVIASGDYKKAKAATWVPGDTLQAAIGQSYYGFSPLQMATMLSTVLNSGTRYKTHILLCVKEYGSDEIYYAPEPVIADEIEIAPEYLNAIKTGMGEVTDEGGTAAILFRNLPGLTTGGKTGTVQIRKTESNNATIVAFAPYSVPELAMSVVIERGAHGTWAGFVAEDVFAYYFGYKNFEQSLDLPEEESEEVEESGEVEAINE